MLRAARSPARCEHRGARYRVSWQSGLPRVPAPPPILLGGLAPRMLELAGEIADGVVLWLAAPAYVRDKAVPAIRRGRERAGKPLQGFEIVAAVPAALTADRAAATGLFRTELTRYLALPFYRTMLEQSGFGARDRGLRPGAAGRSRCPTAWWPRWAASATSAPCRRSSRPTARPASRCPRCGPSPSPTRTHYEPTVEAGATA